MISTQQNRPFPLQSCFSYIVKSVQTKNINTLSVPNTSVIIAIDEHQDTEYLIVPEFEAGDFNHSRGYCYKPFSSLQYAYHAFTNPFSYMIKHAFPSRLTCLLHMITIPLPLVLHVFASRLTHLPYLFRPVVRQLYSLAFH